MNEEQSVPEKASEAEQDTSKVFLGEGTLQSKEEFENEKVNDKDDYYKVDDPKKSANSSIGDGEMLNEGMVGMGNVPEEDSFSSEEPPDGQNEPLR